MITRVAKIICIEHIEYVIRAEYVYFFSLSYRRDTISNRRSGNYQAYEYLIGPSVTGCTRCSSPYNPGCQNIHPVARDQQRVKMFARRDELNIYGSCARTRSTHYSSLLSRVKFMTLVVRFVYAKNPENPVRSFFQGIRLRTSRKLMIRFPSLSFVPIVPDSSRVESAEDRSIRCRPQIDTDAKPRIS